MMEAAPALSMLVAPWLATLLLDWAGIDAIFAWVFGTCAVSSGLLLAYTKWARPPAKTITVTTSAEPPILTWDTLLHRARTGVALIFSQPDLRRLFAVTTVGYLAVGLVQVAMVPVVLAIGTPHDLAWVLTLSGGGAAIGSLVLYAAPPVARVLVGPGALTTISVIQGILLALCGLTQSVTVLLSMAFAYMLLLPALRGARQSILEAVAPPDHLGLLLAVQKGLLQACVPLAAAFAGVALSLAQQVVDFSTWLPGLKAPDASLLFVGAGLACAVCPLVLLPPGTKRKAQ